MVAAVEEVVLEVATAAVVMTAVLAAVAPVATAAEGAVLLAGVVLKVR